MREDIPDINFFFLSDVWLDHPQTFSGLQKIFDNCVENSFIPKVIVLCGNFVSRSLGQGNGRDVQRYQGASLPDLIIFSNTETHSAENFETLADLIASYPMITRNTHFVFVPGPLDYTMNAILPRRPLLSSFVARLKSKLPKVHFASNPCRIKFFGQEIVIFREDVMARMLRNVIDVKKETKSEDLKRFVCHDHFLSNCTHNRSACTIYSRPGPP